MATIDEVLAKMSDTDTIAIEENPIQYLIDNTLRVITVPSNGVVLGVEGDKDVNVVKFKMPRYYKQLDLSEFDIRINYVTAKAALGYFMAETKSIEEDYIYFEWVISAHVVQFQGSVQFAVTLTKFNDGEIDKRFNTTIGKANVLNGLALESEIPDYQLQDLLKQVLNEVMTHVTPSVEEAKQAAITATEASLQASESAKNAANSAKQASVAQTAAETAQNAAEIAQTASETAKTASELAQSKSEIAQAASELAQEKAEIAQKAAEDASIIADNILKGTKTGAVCHTDDAWPTKLLKMSVYGKSEQITTTGANLANLNGVWFDANGATHEVTGNNIVTVRCKAAWARSVLFIPIPKANTSYICSATMPADATHRGITFGVSNTMDGNNITKVQGLNPTNNFCAKVSAENEKYFAVAFYGNNTSTIGDYEMKYKDVMLALGSSAIPYEEYTDGKPSPSPTYPRDITNVTSADVNIIGKNIFGDISVGTINGVTFSKMEDGSITVNGTPTKAYTHITFVLDKSIIGQTITITCTGNVGNGAYDPGAVYPQLTIENASGPNTNAGLYSNMDKLTKTIPSDAKQACIMITCGTDLTQERDATLKVMITIGDSAEPYEPYISTPIPIDLQGHELCGLPDDIRDEVRVDKNGNAELINRSTKAENLQFEASQFTVGSSGKPFMTVGFRPFQMAMNVSNKIVCDKYPYVPRLNGDEEYGCYRTWNAIIFFNTAWEDGEQAARELTEQNPTVICAVPETVTSLGKIEMPALPSTISNVWTNSNIGTDTSIEYVKDVNIAFDKLSGIKMVKLWEGVGASEDIVVPNIENYNAIMVCDSSDARVYLRKSGPDAEFEPVVGEKAITTVTAIYGLW